MSYRFVKINEEKPDANNNISISTSGLSLALSWLPGTTSGINFGASSSGYSSNSNMTFAKHSQYVDLTFGTGVSVSNSSYNPISQQYQSQYFDVVELPEGEYEVIFRYSGSSNSQTLDGTLAIVDNSNSTVLSTKIKTSDIYRNNVIQQIVTAPSGGLDLSFRILAGAANYANSAGFIAQSLVIYKRG
tara:strand:- start:28 stop:591 length:564 start_codon:yes stop_codon:yes gene_type:complete